MEHLIPPGARAPIRVPVAPPPPNGLSEEDDQKMLKAVLGNPSGNGEDGPRYSSLALIAMEKPRELRCFLQFRLWILLLQRVLPHVSVMSEYIDRAGPDRPGASFLKTDPLE